MVLVAKSYRHKTAIDEREKPVDSWLRALWNFRNFDDGQATGGNVGFGGGISESRRSTMGLQETESDEA